MGALFLRDAVNAILEEEQMEQKAKLALPFAIRDSYDIEYGVYCPHCKTSRGQAFTMKGKTGYQCKCGAESKVIYADPLTAAHRFTGGEIIPPREG